MPLTVDVVIPVYGQWELTQRCLDSLAVRDTCVQRVIVVDDASPDDSATRLRARSDVRAVLLTANGGFSHACNAGAQAGDGDAIFFLNNDTIVRPGTIDRLAATLEECGAAAVGPALQNGDGTLQVAGLAMLANATRFTRLYTRLDADLAAAREPYDPVALSGAALMIRRSAFSRAGGFDEAFRNGSEDVDLCLKLWAAGERCRYEPRATIEHVEGASRGKTASNEANDRLLESRWAARATHVPRYAEPLAPSIDLRWSPRTPLDAAVGDHVYRALTAFGGARVVRDRPLVARIAARLDGRPHLSVSHGDTRAARIVFCAPQTQREAAACITHGDQQYWVPTRNAATLLRDAGVAADRIAVTRVGFAAQPGAKPRPLTSAIVVARGTEDARVQSILAALGELPAERVIAEDADAAAFVRIASAPLVVFADTGDAWGALGTAALAGGALVVAPPASGFLEIMPPDTYIAIDDETRLGVALRDVLAAPDALLDRGPRAAREMARRNTDRSAAERMRELGRAFVHGVVPAAALHVTSACAATLRTGVA